MGLGVVALYLLLAVWVSSKLRTRIGYRAWRRIHVLAYGVYAAATIHGLGTGSDTRTVWAPIFYAASVLVVGVLAGRRLLVPATRGQRRRPVLAATAGLAVLLAATWAAGGPFAAHWGARAGGMPGNRAKVAIRAGSGAGDASIVKPPSGTVSTPFSAQFNGQVTVQPIDEAGRVTVRIDGALHGGTGDHLEIYLRGVPLDDGGVAMEQSRVRMGRQTPLYHGEIVALRGAQLVAALRSPRQGVRLEITLNIAGDGVVSGRVHGSRLSRGSA
jgi:hypothetical protein